MPSAPRPDDDVHPARAVGSPFVELNRAAWSGLRRSTPLTLTEADLARVRGLGDRIDLREVEDVYLPLSRLLTVTHVRWTFTGTLSQTSPNNTVNVGLTARIR